MDAFYSVCWLLVGMAFYFGSAVLLGVWLGLVSRVRRGVK